MRGREESGVEFEQHMRINSKLPSMRYDAQIDNCTRVFVCLYSVILAYKLLLFPWRTYFLILFHYSPDEVYDQVSNEKRHIELTGAKQYVYYLFDFNDFNTLLPPRSSHIYLFESV